MVREFSLTKLNVKNILENSSQCILGFVLNLENNQKKNATELYKGSRLLVSCMLNIKFYWRKSIF